MLKSPHPALDLSFMRLKLNGAGIDYWTVEPSGSYTRDCELGRSLAQEFLAYIGENPTNGNMTLLGCIALEMMEKQTPRGIVIGFMAEINGYAMATARLLASREPTEAA
ncbi:MAG: hypothetical protein ACK4P4_09110 [Allorhizobium sp.]